MRIDLRHRLAAVALALVIPAGCSAGDDVIASRPAPSGSVDTIGPDGGPAGGSSGAEAFRSLATVAARLGPEVQGFVADAPAGRIDELAARTCSGVRPRMTGRELGLDAFDGYQRLEPGEREVLTADDWMVLYGALLGSFCPRNVPDLPLDVGVPAADDDVGSYRRLLEELAGVSADSRAFVAGLPDARIDELRGIACAATSSDTSSREFGMAIIESYETDLTVGDRGAVTVTDYGELFGALVGWFCPDRMPR